MAEDVLNLNMAGIALSDHNGLSENVAAALKERDELIYRQWVIINELERKLALYCPLEEFYTGLARNFYQEIGSGNTKNVPETKDIAPTSSFVGLSSPEDNVNKRHTPQQQITQSSSPQNERGSATILYEEKNTLRSSDDPREEIDQQHHYENVELIIHEEEDLNEVTNGEDILVDETSNNFENLLEEFASSDVCGINGSDSFNSSSSEDEEDDSEEHIVFAIGNASSNPCNSGNSTLRKKHKSTKVAEMTVETESQESLGSVEEHLVGSLSAGGTLRRDHPSISKIFYPNSSSSPHFSSSPLSASSPSIFSSSFSAVSLSPSSFSSSPSFTWCPCHDCSSNHQRHPLFSHPLQHSNQQQVYSTAVSKASAPIKPLAPLGLEPWRLKMRMLNNFRPLPFCQDQHSGNCNNTQHQLISRHPSLDSNQCGCKTQSHSNSSLSAGSNSSLEQHHNHQRTNTPRKTPEKISSESLSYVGNTSLCSCETSQKCSGCSSFYQALPGLQSPSSSSSCASHFQFPPQNISHDAFHSYSSPVIPSHHRLQHHSYHGNALNQNQVHHHHHTHLHQRGALTDMYASHGRQAAPMITQTTIKNMSDRSRKRLYRIGLNIFNKKPAKGLEYLLENKFVEPQSNAVAKFLISRKGISRRMIGQYMGNPQDGFSMDVLKCFAEELDLTGLQIDVALRVFQSQFEVSGEAQRIEKFMEAFAARYRECNPHLIGKLFRSKDTIFLLSYAVIMLNTDLHNVNIRPDKKMTMNEFIKNLKGSDDGCDINADYLVGIYERVRDQEFAPLSDHTTQVIMVDKMIQGKKETLVENHRRFVCHFRMHEVSDLTRNERIGVHNRGLFLFNDLLLVTKLSSKKKKNSNHYLKYSLPLLGLAVYLLETPHYKFGIRLKSSVGKVLVTLCANNNEERMKFVEDLRESILETEKMEEYLGRKRAPATGVCHKEAVETLNRYSKDSGVVDVDLITQHQQLQHCKYSDDRRSSRTSVDSGMSSTGSANTNKDSTNSSGKLNRSLSQKGAGTNLG